MKLHSERGTLYEILLVLSFILISNKHFTVSAQVKPKEPLNGSISFGKEFKWGAACAAYQVEGAWDLEGKGPSIWDTFSHKKGKIQNQENGDFAAERYGFWCFSLFHILVKNIS